MSKKEKAYHRADLILKKAHLTPSIVEAVQFHGVHITKDDALLKEVAELYRCANLDELVHNSSIAAKHLQEVGLMENAMALIDTASSSNGYVVNFVVKEPKPFALGAKAGLSTHGDADVSLNAGKQSCFGRGESVNLSYSHSFKGDNNFNLSFSKPRLGWQVYSNICASLYRSMAYLPWNQANLDENALIFAFNGHLLNKKVQHSLKMNAFWRTLRATDQSAFSVREHAGHTLKVSLENSIAFDTRDRSLLATKGILCKMSQELAGVLGDCNFIKTQFDLQAAAPLFSDLALSLSLQMKSVNALGKHELHLLDRVYLGGVYDLRGFNMNSVGARADNSFLGGSAALASVLHLYKPLYPPQMLYAHSWLAGGSVASTHSKNALRDIFDTPRVTAGVGLVFVFKNIFRLELNYVHPLRYVPGDAISSGIHIGAGVNFL